MSRKTSLFACGGFGTNMMHRLLTQSSGAAEQSLELFALDTSESNLKRFADLSANERIHKHLVPKADGSGKHRAENYPAIVSLVEDVVNAGTGDGLHILVYSASGGSGAVIGGELHQALVKRGRSVVSMILGTDASLTDLENTEKTLKTLLHKAGQGTRNYAVFYGSNRQPDGSLSQAAADELFQVNLEDLILLGHPDNQDLDSKDIYHWLNYPINQQTPGTVRFVSLVARSGNAVEEDEEVPVATLSLLAKRGQDPLTIDGVGYTNYGYLSPNLTFSDHVTEVQYQLYAGKSAKLLNQLAGQVTKSKTIAEKAREASAGDSFKQQANDNVSESGTFL